MPYTDKRKLYEAQKKYHKRHQKMILNHAKEIIATRDSLFKLVLLISFTINRTDLTDSEKIAQISKIPIPEEIEQHLKRLPKEVIA